MFWNENTFFYDSFKFMWCSKVKRNNQSNKTLPRRASFRASLSTARSQCQRGPASRLTRVHTRHSLPLSRRLLVPMKPALPFARVQICHSLSLSLTFRAPTYSAPHPPSSASVAAMPFPSLVENKGRDNRHTSSYNTFVKVP